VENSLTARNGHVIHETGRPIIAKERWSRFPSEIITENSHVPCEGLQGRLACDARGSPLAGATRVWPSNLQQTTRLVETRKAIFVQSQPLSIPGTLRNVHEFLPRALRSGSASMAPSKQGTTITQDLQRTGGSTSVVHDTRMLGSPHLQQYHLPGPWHLNHGHLRQPPGRTCQCS
jgi:hypothetical protein